MTTKREWLAQQGLAKAGARGKFSRDAHAAIEAARAKGMTWSDDEPTVRVVREPKTDKPKSEPSGAGAIGEPFMRYPWDQKFRGEDEKGKKHTVNVRQGCFHGKGSIMGCQHTGEVHRVLVGYAQWVDVTPIGE